MHWVADCLEHVQVPGLLIEMFGAWGHDCVLIHLQQQCQQPSHALPRPGSFHPLLGAVLTVLCSLMLCAVPPGLCGSELHQLFLSPCSDHAVPCCALLPWPQVHVEL